jgi:hypothetical protein
MRSELLLALIETRRLIDAGWIQRNWEDEHGNCLIGAMKRACNVVDRLSTEDYMVYRAVHDRLMAQLPAVDNRRFPLVRWNDEPGRTKAEVLDLLRPRHCGDDAGARGQPSRRRPVSASWSRRDVLQERTIRSTSQVG